MAGEDRIGAGLRAIYYGVPNSSGYMQGVTTTPATAGTIQRMQRLRGARVVPLSLPDPEVLPVSGDDEPLVQFTFSAENLPNGSMGLAVHDLDFEALVQGTLTETIGNIKFGAISPDGQIRQPLMFMIIRESKKFEGNVKGIVGWEGAFLNSVEVSPVGSEWEQRAFNPYNYFMVLSKGARAPYGATYTELLRGTTSMPIDPFFSDNPIEVYGGFGDGVTTSYALSNPPVSADGTYTSVFLNGVKQAYTTNYTISGSSLVFVSAPGSGVHIGYMQEILAANMS